MNDIINDLLSKQINMLSDKHTDAEIYRTIQTIDDKYFLLNKTKKSVDLTKSLNEMFGMEFDYKTDKTPVGLTFQELLFKAISFQPSNPFEYIKDRCIVIPKSDDVLSYLDGIDLANRLTGEREKELTSNEVRLYEHKFKERNDKRFNLNFNKIFNSNSVVPMSKHGEHVFRDNHILLEFRISVSGTEEDRQENYHNSNSIKQQEVNKELENFTEMLFGRKFNVNIVESPQVSRNQLKDFDGNTIFRTRQLIFDRGRSFKAKKRKPTESHFYCHAGLFLTYNQYCDIIVKGSLI